MTDRHFPHPATSMTDFAPETLDESWVSAFIDGEAMLSEQGGWTEAIHDRLYYYTITRQVLRGELTCQTRERRVQLQRTAWTAFWARVDAI